MKKYFYLLSAMLMMTATFTSCGDDEVITENTKVLTFEGDYFTKLIDSQQYGGPLLYSADEYKWTDTDNTELSGECVKADWTQWGLGYGWNNGLAISNYEDADAAHGTSTYQLSVPKKNGSNNFAIVYGDNSTLTFADGQAHVIKKMQVMNTTYALYTSWAGIKGDLGAGYKFFVTVTADNGASKEIVLAENNNAIEDWTTVDLSSLGKVKTLTFTFGGTNSDPKYGLNTPKYVAIDNIVIVK